MILLQSIHAFQCLYTQQSPSNFAHPTASQSGPKLPDSVADKLARARVLKEEGNAVFKQQEWKKAIKKYHHSLMYAKGVTDRPDKLMGLAIPTKFNKPTKDEEREAEELLVSLHNNIAGVRACVTVCG